MESVYKCRLIKFQKGGNARIGVMPRYGDADTLKWFDVKPHCTFHILNCFEDGDEVTNNKNKNLVFMVGTTWGGILFARIPGRIPCCWKFLTAYQCLSPNHLDISVRFVSFQKFSLVYRPFWLSKFSKLLTYVAFKMLSST